MVLGDAPVRISNEAHAASFEIVETAEIIEYLASSWVCQQGVDREVAPRGVLLPIVSERDRRPPAVRGHVSPEARYLDDVTAADGGDRAVIDSGWHRADLDRFQPGNHVLGLQSRRQVDVVDWKVKQFVADRSAHVSSKPLVCSERIEKPGHSATSTPFGCIELHDHCSLRERLTITAAVAPQILRPFQRIS